ncbi:MAG: hypothetical protein M3081_20040 [Gemmatimonadota bacterium]|nr:hypothetical protein [Gemmatimonadota bacterium]
MQRAQLHDSLNATANALGIPSYADALSRLMWPMIVAVVLWRLWPLLRVMLDSRRFTIKIAGFELSVQEASEALQKQIDDVQRNLSGLWTELSLPLGHTVPEPAQRTARRRLLWVDDNPQRSAFELARLQREGFDVRTALTTAEAMRALDAGHAGYAAVVTVMTRTEGRTLRATAGLDVLTGMARRGLSDLPVLIYASSKALADHRAQAMSLGARGLTSSPLELFNLLRAA